MVTVLLLLGAVLANTATMATASHHQGRDALLRQLLTTACAAGVENPGVVFKAIDGVTSETAVALQGPGQGWSRQLQLGKSDEATVVARGFGGQIRQLTVTHSLVIAGTTRPKTFIAAGPNCRIRAARRLTYDASGRALQVDLLDNALRDTGNFELLNPPIPEGVDPGGIAVAMLDAGVNYTLPEIAARLARDADGNALGFDFWDLDKYPFDANPARSAFFAQRHGTRTASVLLREAPVARLIPYRYPRPDMSRMTGAIQHAREHGVRIFNISLGSNRYADWQDFESAARATPDLLFIVSAGNNGRNIDKRAVYPAALSLPNLITVTSAENSGVLAQGSNWGANSVDLMVPGERQLVTGFNGQIRAASGSSYAVARVSALAACLLAKTPEMKTADLKKAIFSYAQPDTGNTKQVAIGFLPDPVSRDRGLCPKQQSQVTLTETFIYEPESSPVGNGVMTFEFRPVVVIVKDSGWERPTVEAALDTTARVLQQCGIQLPGISIHLVEGPERYRYYLQDNAVELIRQSKLGKPIVYLLHDTLEREPFDAVSFGRENSRRRPELADTVWVTRQLPHPGLGVAHELVHVLMNSGLHVTDPDNLMYERTSGDNWRLTLDQCERMVSVGETNGLLHRISLAE